MDLITLQKKKEDCRTWKNVEPWFTKIQEVSKAINIDDFTLESHHSSAWVDENRFHFTFETFDNHTLVYTYQTKILS